MLIPAMPAEPATERHEAISHLENAVAEGSPCPADQTQASESPSAGGPIGLSSVRDRSCASIQPIRPLNHFCSDLFRLRSILRREFRIMRRLDVQSVQLASIASADIGCLGCQGDSRCGTALCCSSLSQGQ